MIKVILFDMGNTLLHFHKGRSDEEKDFEGLRKLTEYLKRLNSSIAFEEVKTEFFHKWMEKVDIRNETSIEYPIEDFLNGYLEKYDIELSTEQCIEAINTYYTEYKKELYWDKNLHEILKEIKYRGYKIGVVSNTCYYDEVMKDCFKIAGVYDLIDNFIFSYSLRIGKPRKEIFNHAINCFGICAEEAIFVGDGLKNDIEPAKLLGMKTIWLNNKESINETTIIPDFEVRKLCEVLEHIR